MEFQGDAVIQQVCAEKPKYIDTLHMMIRSAELIDPCATSKTLFWTHQKRLQIPRVSGSSRFMIPVKYWVAQVGVVRHIDSAWRARRRLVV